VKALLASPEFRAELPGWTLRGMLCAATSAFWAALMGFQSPAEIAGMAAGVACWVVAFAAASAAARAGGRAVWADAAAALRDATWIKVALTGMAWLVYCAAAAVGFSDLLQIALLGMTDVLLGLAALYLVAFLAGAGAPDRLAGLDSFGWTWAATVTEGALMAAVILALALLVFACRRGWAALAGHVFLSPARQSD